MSSFVGDCCGDDVNTDYCDDCDCLDPNYTPTTTESTCADKKSKKQCRRIKKRGKCDTASGKKNCQKMCGHCSWIEIHLEWAMIFSRVL